MAVVRIRNATELDLADVALIAELALTAAYEDLLEPATLRRYLDASYSPVTLGHRYSDHPIYVAEADDEICAFADAYIQDGGIVIAEICTLPKWRRQGCATQLVRHLARMDVSLPLSADVLLGNETGERFYEALGFVPGEIVQMQFYGAQLVEQRWWHPPLAATA